MKKNLYRKHFLEIRNNIDNKVIKDSIIFEKVIHDKKVINADLILIYVSLSDEVDTHKLIAYLLKYKKVAVPKIINNEMFFYYINSFDDLKPGFFNVLEPYNNNQVKLFNNCISITPGICFSRNLYRLGYGKGFYDKFYCKYKSIYKIGLCYHELLLDNIPHDKFDQKVDKIISD